MQNLSLVRVPFRAKREVLCKRCECVCQSEREGTGEGEGMFLGAARFIANSNQSKTFCVSFHKGIAFTANFDSKLASKMGFPSPDDFFESGNKHFDIKSVRFWDPHFC